MQCRWPCNPSCLIYRSKSEHLNVVHDNSYLFIKRYAIFFCNFPKTDVRKGAKVWIEKWQSFILALSIVCHLEEGNYSNIHKLATTVWQLAGTFQLSPNRKYIIKGNFLPLKRFFLLHFSERSLKKVQNR